MAVELFEVIEIDNIVAFGLGTLSPPAAKDTSLELVAGSQHASLIIIREVWEQLHPNAHGKFQIFLQDPWHKQQDVDVAKHFRMTVVNAGIGYHVGCLKINGHSLVVEFAASQFFPIFEMALEITRPAAFFQDWPVDASWFKDHVASNYTFSYPWQRDRQDTKTSLNSTLYDFPGDNVYVKAIPSPLSLFEI